MTKQEAILEAMRRANPDKEGDLMRKLKLIRDMALKDSHAGIHSIAFCAIRDCTPPSPPSPRHESGIERCRSLPRLSRCGIIAH